MHADARLTKEAEGRRKRLSTIGKEIGLNIGKLVNSKKRKRKTNNALRRKAASHGR